MSTPNFARLFAFAFTCLLTAGAAQAQTVVGTTIIDGRQAELLSNNTWRFTATNDAGANCTTIDVPISYCGDTLTWQRMPVTPSPAIDAMFQRDDRTYAMMIVEGVGLRDGLTDAALREVVLQNAAAAAGVPLASLPVVEDYEAVVDGVAYPTIVFQATLQGLTFTYHTTMVLQDYSATQLTTYTIGAGLSPTQQTTHEDFVSAVRVDVEQ